jgi:polysaccharide pyruvyl transferase WcaK-like protein
MDWLRKLYLYAHLWRSMRKISSLWTDLPAAGAASDAPRIFLFSRYGTETVGNHFIQLGLLRVCFHTLPERQVYLLSARPHITEKGLTGIIEILKRSAAGLPLASFIAERVTVLKEAEIRTLGRGDLLVLGGGPIMDDPALVQWESWFQWAERAGASILIAGCGLGPLRHKKTISIAESLLKHANATTLRNRPQRNFASAARFRHTLAPDPAFLCAPLLVPRVGIQKRRLLAVNARVIGFDSNPLKKISTDEIVARVVDHVLSVKECLPIDGVFPFSTQEDVDSPDSVVAVRVARLVAEKLQIELLPFPETSVPAILDALSQAEFVVSTRMHGFILGMLFGCRAACLDYIANGGKTTDFYRDWLGRDTAPSIYLPGSLHCEDFALLSNMVEFDASGDRLLSTYATAMRQALAQ